MPVTNEYLRIPLDQITVATNRQRTEIDTSDLDDSIRQRGVLAPILVSRLSPTSYQIIFGERRFTSSKKLGLPDIPARIAEDLPETELQIIELEENLKRRDLPWRDAVAAVSRIHQLFIETNETWSQERTAAALNMTTANISMYLRVARDIASPKIAQASGFGAAYNILSRADERAMGDTLSEILEAGNSLLAPVSAPSSAPGEAPPPPSLKITPPDESILLESFLTWAPNYTGPKFNLIHCDFPYGINVFAGPQSGSTSHTTYNDSPDVYWALCRTLASNLDRLMAHSGHLMFWLSADIDIMFETIAFFNKNASSLQFNPKPLIWHKTDNMGILADSKRGPRHIYEACLFASREDRLIVRATSDCYGAPTDKAYHPSTKPEPVLRQFMSMFVDENTRLLDPTCGGGSSLRAAESLGAKQVLGLEIDPEHCANARSALRQFRALRSLNK